MLIGPTAAIFHDEHSTPFTTPRQMGGPEIHLQFINAALRGEFLREPSPGVALTHIRCAGALAAALCFLIRPPGKRLLAVAALGIGCAVLSHLLYNHGRLLLPVAVPLLVMVLCSLLVFAYDFGFFARTEASALVIRFSNDLSSFEHAQQQARDECAQPVLNALLSAVLLFTLDWRLGLLALLALPACFLGPRLITSRSASFFRTACSSTLPSGRISESENPWPAMGKSRVSPARRNCTM